MIWLSIWCLNELWWYKLITGVYICCFRTWEKLTSIQFNQRCLSNKEENTWSSHSSHLSHQLIFPWKREASHQNRDWFQLRSVSSWITQIVFPHDLNSSPWARYCTTLSTPWYCTIHPWLLWALPATHVCVHFCSDGTIFFLKMVKQPKNRQKLPMAVTPSSCCCRNKARAPDFVGKVAGRPTRMMAYVDLK